MSPADREHALEELKRLAEMTDKEVAHGEADKVLLDLIGDDEITAAWVAGGYWFA